VGLADLLSGCHDKIYGNAWKMIAKERIPSIVPNKHTKIFSINIRKKYESKKRVCKAFGELTLALLRLQNVSTWKANVRYR
jgi:hypothetical protein